MQPAEAGYPGKSFPDATQSRAAKAHEEWHSGVVDARHVIPTLLSDDILASRSSLPFSSGRDRCRKHSDPMLIVGGSLAGKIDDNLTKLVLTSFAQNIDLHHRHILRPSSNAVSRHIL